MSSRPQVSVITSCFSGGLETTAARLGSCGVDTLDLYCFELSDREDLLDKKIARLAVPGESNTFCLGDIDKKTYVEHELFEWVVEQLDTAERRCGKRMSIAAVTTDFSSISDPARRKSRKIAIHNLVCVLRLAHLLGLKTVQARAGRVLYPHSSGDRRKAMLSPTTESITRILNALREVDKEVGVEIGIALEPEPGVAHVLRDLKALEELWQTLRSTRYDCLRVGLNLDVGHMFVMAVEPDILRERLSSLPPVLSAHISDHSIDHFADLPPGTFHDTDQFRDWLRLFFTDVPAALPKTYEPFYTANISVELEAVECDSSVRESYHFVRSLLDTVGVPSRRLLSEAVVLFADLRNSTLITHKLEASGRVELVAEFTHLLFQAIGEAMPREAVLDKFTGDGAMIIFTGGQLPELASAAVECAREVVANCNRKVYKVAPFLAEHGIGEVQFGFGLGAGTVVRGVVGEPPFSEDATLGTPVIDASRLSSAAREGECWAYHSTAKKCSLPESAWSEVQEQEVPTSMRSRLKEEPIWRLKL